MLEKTFSFWRRLVAAKTDSPPHEEQERRLWVRYAADLAGSVQLPDASPNDKFLARIRDLSRGGANLETDRPLKLGQMLTLELAGDDHRSLSVLACAVRVTAHGEKKWSLGCVFSRELSDHELEQFGARKIAAETHDKRTWVRHDCDVKAVYRKVGDAVTVSHPAKVLNISANGIGLSVHPSLSAGALLNVDLLDRTGRMVRTILACVVHTTERSEGDFAIGCNFIRELHEDELQALLN